MSVLERFLILFESDSEEVKKGADDAKKSTDKLEDGIKKTDQAATKLGQSFLRTATMATTAIAASLSVATILAGVFSAAQYADKLDELSESLGVSVEELDAWGGAAKMAGGSLEGLTGSVRTLASGLSQLDVTGKSKIKPFFDDVGISLTNADGKARPALELLRDVAGVMETMSKEQAIGFGKKIGLDDGTIMLLQKGRREVDALIARQKELGTVRQEDAAAAAEYNDEIDNTARVFRSMFSIIAGDVLPVLSALLRGLQSIGRWMADHEGFIYGFLGTLIALLTTLAIRAGLAAIPLIALAAPFLAIGAAILAVSTLIGLLIDDFVKFSEGAAHWIPWGAIIESFQKIKDGVLAFWTGFMDYITESLQGIGRAFEAIGDFFSFGDRAYSAANAKRHLAMTNTPLASQTSSSVMSVANGGNRSVAIGEVNIQTQATDSDGIANEIGTSLQREIQQVTNNADDGIAG